MSAAPASTDGLSAAAALAGVKAVILAGGLDPENVGDAVRTVRPYGVDVASGVEKAPGRKDPRKVHDFVKRARVALEDRS